MSEFIGMRGTRRRMLDKHGYVWLSAGEGRRHEYEHRCVMSEILGRELTRREHVHHKKAPKSNNDPSNLELLTASAHIGHHNTVTPKRKKGVRSAYDEHVHRHGTVRPGDRHRLAKLHADLAKTGLCHPTCHPTENGEGI